MREIEIKLRVKDFTDLENRLVERGCILSEPISQHDVIYSEGGSTEEWKHSKEGDKVVRIRHMKDSAELTLKIQRSRDGDALEYETEVKDPDTMHQILSAFGYKPEIEVKKVRRQGKLGEYSICLDRVEELGTFMELEKLTDDSADPGVVREELFKVLESLGLSRADEETRGYDSQMYQLRHQS